MMYVFGSRLFGKVDVVPGLFHVETKFGHLNFVPLIPMQSYVILSKSGKSFRGVPIPLSGKSVLICWGRLLAGAAAVVGGVITLVQMNDYRYRNDWQLAAVVALIGAVVAGFLFFYKGLTRASFNRACDLSRQIGLGERGLAEIQRIYGQAAGRGFDVTPPSQAATQPAYSQPAYAQPAYAQPQYATPQSAAGAAGFEDQAQDDENDRGAYGVSGEVQTTFWLRGTHRQSRQAVCVPVVATDGRQARAMGNAQGIDVATVQYQDGRLA